VRFEGLLAAWIFPAFRGLHSDFPANLGPKYHYITLPINVIADFSGPTNETIGPSFHDMKLMLTWLVVALPLGWGVTQSVKKAMPLLQAEAVVSGTPSAPQ